MNFSDNVSRKIPRELEGKLNQTQERVLGRIMVLTKLGEKGYCILSKSDLAEMGVPKGGNTTKSIQELIDMNVIVKKVCFNKKTKTKETRYWLDMEHNTADWQLKEEKAEDQNVISDEDDDSIKQGDDMSPCTEEQSEQSTPYKGDVPSPYQSDRSSLYQGDSTSQYSGDQGDSTSPSKGTTRHPQGDTTSPSTFINICDHCDINMCEGNTHEKTASNDQDFLPTSEEKKSEDSKPKTLSDLVKSKEPYKSTQTPSTNVFSFPRSELLAQEPACYEEVYEYLDEYKTNFKTQFPEGTFDKVDVSEVAGVFWRKNSAKKWRNKNDWRTEAINWFERQRRYIAEHPEQFEKKKELPEVEKDTLDELTEIANRMSYGS